MRDSSALPEVRLDDIAFEELADEVLIYDHRSDVAHCLNAVAARVWKACREGGTRSDFLVRNPDVDEATLRGALSELRGHSLLAEEPLIVRHAMSRRQLVGNAAAVAVGATFVTSIVAPTPAHAASVARTACSGTMNQCATSGDVECLSTGSGGQGCGHGGYCCPSTAHCSAGSKTGCAT